MLKVSMFSFEGNWAIQAIHFNLRQYRRGYGNGKKPYIRLATEEKESDSAYKIWEMPKSIYP